MQAIARGNHTRLSLLAACSMQRANEAFVLTNTRIGHSRAITIRNLIGKTGTNTCLLYNIGNDIQATINSIWTGMMIDNAGCAVTDGIDHKYFGTGTSIFQGKKFVESPPETLKYFRKVTWWLT